MLIAVRCLSVLHCGLRRLIDVSIDVMMQSEENMVDYKESCHFLACAEIVHRRSWNRFFF